jgi:hypothetical protein
MLVSREETLFFWVSCLFLHFLATVYILFVSLRAPRDFSWRPSTSFLSLYGFQETFLGDRLHPFCLFTGSKNLSWRPSTPFFTLYGLQEPFLATVYILFVSLRAPRTFLGDRLLPFLLSTGSKNLSWRPSTPFFTLYGIQEPFLVTVYSLFYSLRAPRAFPNRRKQPDE